MLEAELQQKSDQAFHNRLIVMSAIYKHQGDTPFYRKMLSSNAGMFSQILANAAGDAAVTHEHVLAYLGQAEPEPEIEAVEEEECEVVASI